MDVSAVSRRINPADLPLDRLATNSKLSEAEKVNAVSHHFEAILLRQFLTEALKPILKANNALSGASNAIYQDMIVTHLADEISKTGMFGLASAFQSQMPLPQKASDENGKRDAPIE
jgi:Rod binding domain-containing protein